MGYISTPLISGSQDFIWQVNRSRQSEGALSSPKNGSGNEPNHMNLEIFTGIHNAFESKKKCVSPSVILF